MRRRFSLSARILVLACLNVVLVAVFFLVFARIKFRFNLQSFLLAPARATVASGSRLIEADLSQSSPASWMQLLAHYESLYPARFYLFDYRLRQLAGAPVRLPPDIAALVRNDPFGGGNEPRNDRGQPHSRPPPEVFGPPPDGDRPPPGDGTPPPPRRAAGERPDPSTRFIHTTQPRAFWVAVHFPIWQPVGGEPIHATLLWFIPSLWTERAFFDYRPWLLVAIAITVSLAICWVPFLRSLTRTVGAVQRATREMAEGNFEVQLPVRRRDELGELSRSIAHMAEQLSGHINGQKRFLSDVAHELASPIARIHAGLGIVEQRSDAATSDYLADVIEDVEHMSTLVAQLLAFSKTRAVRQAVELTVIPLASVIEAVLAREAATRYRVDDSVRQLPAVLAVPDCLDRAIANLVRNAIRYGGDSGTITISSTTDHDFVQLSIGDEGPGLPPHELENVFRAFYRPEFARQRETGGTGLGLAIVRDCIEACRGSVHLRNRSPHGLEAVVRLRLAP